jgi:2-succinyl-6-hydroxy-2,4-cyclohexadiene-1-carboxylate synthase
MILSYKQIKINVEFFSDFKPENKSILFLHGFTGSAYDWQEIKQKISPVFNTIALDLIGHGKSSSPADIKFYKSDEIVNQLLFITDYLKIEKAILCGYSMGGRAALSFATTHPEKISALILESTSAGIENEEEKKTRIIGDEQLADFIEYHSIEEFVDKWMEMELFSSLKKLPTNKLLDLKMAKLQNSKIGLANSLRGFGTGLMPYLGNEIKKMNFPVLLITGGLDSKFTKLNKVLFKQFPNAEHKIAESVGHNFHFEKPEDFIAIVNQFIKQF